MEKKVKRKEISKLGSWRQTIVDWERLVGKVAICPLAEAFCTVIVMINLGRCDKDGKEERGKQNSNYPAAGNVG